MTLADQRYTVTLEYCGHDMARWVARFCGEWIGQDKHKSGAVMLCIAHADDRNSEHVSAATATSGTDRG